MDMVECSLHPKDPIRVLVLLFSGRGDQVVLIYFGLGQDEFFSVDPNDFGAVHLFANPKWSVFADCER